MENVGAYLVAGDAVDFLVETIENIGKDVTKKALEFTEQRKAKTLSADDVADAIKAL